MKFDFALVLINEGILTLPYVMYIFFPFVANMVSVMFVSSLLVFHYIL